MGDLGVEVTELDLEGCLGVDGLGETMLEELDLTGVMTFFISFRGGV